jgi:hypothetical protein
MCLFVFEMNATLTVKKNEEEIKKKKKIVEIK